MSFNIEDYLKENGWNKKQENLFARGYKTVKLVSKGKLMIALNFDARVKHKHIVTCLVPTSTQDADVLFNLTQLQN